MKDLGFYLRRIIFLGAFAIAGLAVVEKTLNIFGYMLLGDYYTPWRLLEFSAVLLIFVVVLQLREINISLTRKTTKEEPK